MVALPVKVAASEPLRTHIYVGLPLPPVAAVVFHTVTPSDAPVVVVFESVVIAPGEIAPYVPTAVVTPPVVVALHAPVPFNRTQYVVAALALTARVLAVVVAGVSGFVPTVAPVPHSYTAPEPVEPPVAVKVMLVDTPLHSVDTLDDSPVGAVGGVATTLITFAPLTASRYAAVGTDFA